jgi:hypothetical protein
MKSTGVLSLLSCTSLMFACAGSPPAPAATAIEQANVATEARAEAPAPPRANEPCAATTTSDDPAIDHAKAAAGASAAPQTQADPVIAAESDLSPPRAVQSARNHRGKVKELFGLMDMQKIIDATLEDTISTQIKANPALAQFKDVMLEFLAKHMSWKSLERGFVEDYMETFSQSEIEDMIAFYKTPTGAKAIATMPALMKRGARRGLESVEKHMPELQKTIEERLKSQ